ncbi:hypothetical protein [Pannonibacter indicus]|uniref:hypothetical protein n=1 Tax=Pannonibacter indicus TaxID=466044 RepID=UPI00391A4CEA
MQGALPGKHALQLASLPLLDGRCLAALRRQLVAEIHFQLLAAPLAEGSRHVAVQRYSDFVIGGFRIGVILMSTEAKVSADDGKSNGYSDKNLTSFTNLFHKSYIDGW